MKLEKLKLQQFRNIADLDLEFKKNVIVFEGDNGQGKTNIVEGIYLLSKGSSFRTSDVTHLIQREFEKNKEVSIINGILEKDGVEHHLRVHLSETKKQIFVDEKKTTALKSFQKMPVILFSPESLAAIKEGPEHRRSLIDETLIIKKDSNLRIIQDYKKILKTKNSVLRQFKKGLIALNQVRDLLFSLNQQFVRISHELVSERLSLIQEINPQFKNIFNEMTHQNVDISVRYVVSEKESENANEITNTMRNRLVEKMDIELSSGTSLIGPHKHDIVFSFEKENSRYYCSQGQQRALILAYKLTQILYHKALYGYYPILILDDVLSELDKEKRAFLIGFLSGNKAQTFLTTTDIEKSEALEILDVQIFKVVSGNI